MRRKPQLPLIAAAILLIAGLLAAIPVASSADPSLGQLNNELGQQQSEQQNLQDAISNLDGLINGLDSQISLVQTREANVRAQLAKDRAQLAATRKALAEERRQVAILKARLARAQMLLADQLVSNYEGNQPDVVGVVLDSRGFNQLLESLRYLHDAEHQQQSIISITTAAKRAADAAEVRLANLETTRKRITDAAAEEAHALANMDALLHSKEAALQSARSAKESALAASKSRGAALQSQINHIEAQQAAAEKAAQNADNAFAPTGGSLGPSGGWAIPWAIVNCESGGQNFPPNSAGASGYYQIIPSTWAEYGGAGPAAYLAPKSEQDAVARRIWAGSGPGAWDCARIVGII
jgi:septal ring factor EnvC (AmiA/AmiB activator)